MSGRGFPTPHGTMSSPCVPNLPLDLWAQVARFVRPCDRDSLFVALRRAMLIPTHGSLHETRLRFHEAAAKEESELHAARFPGVHPRFPSWPPEVLAELLEMGFEHDQVVHALTLSDGDRFWAVMRLLADVDWEDP